VQHGKEKLKVEAFGMWLHDHIKRCELEDIIEKLDKEV